MVEVFILLDSSVAECRKNEEASNSVIGEDLSNPSSTRMELITSLLLLLLLLLLHSATLESNINASTFEGAFIESPDLSN